MATLLNQNTSIVKSGMDFREAYSAISQKLSGYTAAMIKNTTDLENLAETVTADLDDVITDEWQVKADVTITTTTVSGTPAEETTPESITVVSDAAITIELSTVTPEGITTPEGIATFTERFDLADKKITPPAVSSFSSISTGTAIASTVPGIQYDHNAIGARKGTITLTVEDGNVTDLKVINGVYSFDTVYDPKLKAFTVKEGDYPVNEQKAYNELLSKYFVVSEMDSAYNIKVHELDESTVASGAMTIVTSGSGIDTDMSSFNGGYKRVAGGILFMDTISNSEKLSDGIYLMEDAAIGILASGEPVQLTINYPEGSDKKIENASLLYSPNMIQQVDSGGRPVYSILTYSCYNSLGVKLGEVDATGPEEALSKAQITSGLTATTEVRHTGYNTSSLPVYTTQKQKRTSLIFMNLYDWTDPYGNTVRLNFDYQSSTGKTYVYMGYTPVFEYVPNTVFLRPSGDTAEVSYLSVANFGLVAGSDGYADIANGMRVALGGNSDGFARGTLVFTDENHQAKAKYTPDKVFYALEANKVIEYGKSTLTFEAGTSWFAHQVIDDVYMSLPDDSRTGTIDDSFYFKSDYFGVNENGDLVKLYTETGTFNFADEGYETGIAYNGAKMLRIYSPEGDGKTSVAMRILSTTGNAIVILLPYGTWADSKGNQGKLSPELKKETTDYTGATEIRIGTLEGKSVNLEFRGNDTSLTGTQTADVNIKADQAVVIAGDNGDIFSKDSQLILAPKFNDRVSLQLKKDSSGTAYSGEAYFSTISETGAGETTGPQAIALHDTGIGSGGEVGLTTSNGSITIQNVTVDMRGTLTASTTTGSIELDEVTNSGSLSVRSGGDSDITVDRVKNNSSGDLSLTTEDGSVLFGKVNSDGILTVKTASGGAFMIDSDSILTLGADTNEEASRFDLDGDLGSPDKVFKINILEDPDGKLQTLHLVNVNNIYLIQDTGIKTQIDGLDTTGRDANGNTTTHDEATGDLDAYDETVWMVVQGQSPEELAAQFVNGGLSDRDLMDLLDCVLTGINVKTALGITDEMVDGPVNTLDQMTVEQLTQLAEQLNLVIAENTDEMVYRADVKAAYKAYIMSTLAEESVLSKDQVEYLLTINITENAEELPKLLAAAISGKTLDDSRLFDAYWTTLTDGQKQALIEEAWKLANYPDPEDVTEEPRGLDIHIGTSTGTSSISNNGDITVCQDIGTFTADGINSKYGDVAITSSAIEGTEGTVNINGEHITLKATSGGIGASVPVTVNETEWIPDVIAKIVDEEKSKEAYGNTGDNSWTISRNPETGMMEINFSIDYTSVRDEDQDIATFLTALAEGDIHIAEALGDLGINVIESKNGSVTLTAPGSILDTRTGGETSENVIAHKGANLTSEEGTIGTRDDYLSVNVTGGALTVNSYGDINVSATDSLDMVADINGSSGQINVTAENDLRLENTHGNMTLGAIAAGGNADIKSKEGFELGDKLGNKAQVKADSIRITAENGSIGTDLDPLDVDTDAGSGLLSADAKNGTIYINEVSGNLIIGTVNSTGGGTVTLTTENGNIIETPTAGADLIAAAARAAMEAAQAKSKADAAQTKVDILQSYFNRLTEAKSQIEGAKDQMRQLENDLLDRLNALEAARTYLENAKNNLTSAEAACEQAKLATAEAKQNYDQADLNKKKADSDLAAAQMMLDTLLNADPQDEEAIASQRAIVAGLKQVAEAADSALGAAGTALETAKADEDAKKQAVDDVKPAIVAAEGAVSQTEADVKAAQKAIQEKQAEITLLISQLDIYTYGNIAALKNRTDVDAAAAAVNAEYSAAETLLNTAIQTRDDLAALANTAKQAADQALEEAEALGIRIDGDLNLILKNGGSVGESGNALGITVDGNLNIRAGADRAPDNVYLESGGSLNLNPLTAAGEVVIHSSGDINGSDNAGGSVITAEKAELTSLAGNIGRDSRPFRTTVDRITAMADYIYLDNSKSLTVDEVIGSTVNVKADGDILSGNAGSGNDDNDIIAENLNMIGGDIGVSGGAVKIQAGKLSSNSNNLNVRSDDNIVIGEIRAGNNVELSAGGTISAHQSANTAINAGNLALQSVGSIGGDGASMNVRVSGTTTGDVQYGYAYLTNKYQAPSHNRRGGSGGGGGAEITIKDQSTGIIISGELSGELVVTDIRQALQDDSVVSRIIEKLGLEKVLKAYKIQITGSVSGAVTVTIPVERQYNGKTITVIYEQSGKMFATNVTVENDSVSMEVELPGDFIVLDDIYPVKFVDLKTSEFEDVALTDWFFEGVAYAYGMNLMNGTDGNEFSPQESLTRAMLAVILFRLEGRPGPKDGHAPANWYEDGMNWAISSGIIMNDVPGEQITREQFIMMLYRYAAMKGWKLDYDYDLSSFGDAGNVSDYTMDAMKWAISIGLVKGRDDHNLAPGDNLTRAETATLLKRFTDLFPTGMLVIREN